MTIEYTIDFTHALPQKLAPRLNEVQTWLNCNVTAIGRGNIIIQIRPGVFTLKVHDDAKGKSLENLKLNYFLPGDTLGKNPVVITILKREPIKKWVNPKFITTWGVHKEDLDGVVTNKILNQYMEKYGTILEPVEDVLDLSTDSWALDKKKCRVDLDKELDIPRLLPIEMRDKNGEFEKGTIRIIYKDQPWFCGRCKNLHPRDCPK